MLLNIYLRPQLHFSYLVNMSIDYDKILGGNSPFSLQHIAARQLAISNRCSLILSSSLIPPGLREILEAYFLVANKPCYIWTRCTVAKPSMGMGGNSIHPVCYYSSDNMVSTHESFLKHLTNFGFFNREAIMTHKFKFPITVEGIFCHIIITLVCTLKELRCIIDNLKQLLYCSFQPLKKIGYIEIMQPNSNEALQSF